MTYDKVLNRAIFLETVAGVPGTAPASYTLHLTPHTPHPTPCTLHPAPTPNTPNPAVYTLHPSPYTLHPAGCRVHGAGLILLSQAEVHPPLLNPAPSSPGMAAGMLRHLRSLRRMDRDHGWIHTLLEASPIPFKPCTLGCRV